ncbi:MAG: hypothetical protein RLN79_06920 [Cytophagales bacterium]
MFLRKIKDIRIIGDEIHAIRKTKITTKELELQISDLQYSGQKLELEENVEQAQLPPFVQVFYYYFFAFLKIPSEVEFWNIYNSWINPKKKETIVIKNKKLKTLNIKSRLLRTYPSLIRDLHFLYLLNESRKFDSIEYSMHRDYFDGIDLRVRYKNVDSYISLYINTERGDFYKKRKTKRHDYSVINEIEFKVNFDELKKCGSIYLLKEFHVHTLINLIDE